MTADQRIDPTPTTDLVVGVGRVPDQSVGAGVPVVPSTAARVNSGSRRCTRGPIAAAWTALDPSTGSGIPDRPRAFV
ncbi:hypothetical protein GALL_348010 [mine drainage metagenome]|uniref:Uncharacterized protein n=1 Tax=mine drainage metagenome TaxID=410659 RepID=A0A1J5QIM7_9ZZZZ